MEILPTVIVQEPDDEVDVDLDTSNPRSLINLVPTFLKLEIQYLPKKYFEMSNAEVEAAFRERWGGISQDCVQVKTQFWEEYDYCQRWQTKQMRADIISAGVGKVPWFKSHFSDKFRLAWLIRMPATYEQSLAEIHKLSMTRMKSIMALDPTAGPKLDTKLMDVQFKISQHVDQRVKGAVVQVQKISVDQTSKNLNVNVNKHEMLPAAEKQKPMTMDEIDRQLKQLKARSAALEAPGGVPVDLMKPLTHKDSEEDILAIHAEHKIPTTGY